MSRIGRKPITVPEKVKVAIAGKRVNVEGPKGKLSWDLPGPVSAALDKQTVTITVEGGTRQVRALHGLARSLVANMVLGAGTGFVKKLEIQGVGFKAGVQGKNLNLNLGYSHPIAFPIPEGITVTVTDAAGKKVPEGTFVTVEGADKQLVGAVAADIRGFYPPEPYKGKGVRYAGEHIIRKAGKTAQSK